MNNLTKNKRNYPTLDKLISDDYTENTDQPELDNSSLSLKSCLLNDPQGCLRILNDNIEAISNVNYPNGNIKSIISKLKNNTDGLVNTASELGLMRYYVNKGLLEDFDYPYFIDKDTQGDFDIKIHGHNRSILLDVLNFKLQEYDFSIFESTNNDIHKKFYDKVAEKSRKKHIPQLVRQNTIDADYGIAIDWTKDWQISVATLLTTIIYPELMKQKAKKILDQMPHLSMLVFYNYDIRYHEAYNIISQSRDS